MHDPARRPMRQRRHAIACTTSAVHQLPCVVTRKVEVLQVRARAQPQNFPVYACMHVGSILKKVLLLLVRGALHEADRRAESHKLQGETRACCHALSSRMMRRKIWRLETWRNGRQGKARQGSQIGRKALPICVMQVRLTAARHTLIRCARKCTQPSCLSLSGPLCIIAVGLTISSSGWVYSRVHYYVHRI